MRSDIERYKRQVRRIDLAGIDLTAFHDDPLPAPVLRCLRYMHDVEHHTVCYLRDLLVTPAHRDLSVTTFLTLWSYEELWHGEAIGQVLAAHGEAAGGDRIAPLRRRLGWPDRLSPVLHSLGSSLVGESFPAIHMTWGAVNEWTTQAGYARLGALSGHPVLRELLGRIMRQEGRHIDYYRSRAVELLDGSPGAPRTTRRVLRLLWHPVGAKVMPAAETRHLVRTLFGGPDGRAMAQRVDRRIDLLPGLGGLGLVRGALDRYTAAA
jgi:hypothetical protein